MNNENSNNGTLDQNDQANEFPEGAEQLDPDFSRRDFMQLMGASFGLAGVGMLGVGCRRPAEQILPFGEQPEGYVHGVPQYFATARPTRTGAVPVVVESNEGRPTKVEGNSKHPDSNGGTDLYTQASILDLYDPDRAQQFRKSGEIVRRADALAELKKVIASSLTDGGAKTAFLFEPGNSPSRARMLGAVKSNLPQAKFYTHDPLDLGIHVRAATKAFGKSVRPRFHFDKAKVVLSLDCDFIGSEDDAHRHIRDFTKGRKLNGENPEMSRLYVVEALMTQTGANADHRLRSKLSDVYGFAAAIAGRVGVDGLSDGAISDVKWVEKCVEDLKKAGKEALIVAGHRQPLAVHVLAHAMNQVLGSLGETVELLPADDLGAPVDGTLAELKLAIGGVDTLVMLGGNPVYDAPSDLGWSEAQKKVKTVVRLAYREDESAEGCHLHLPKAHYLESWGDARTNDGTLVPIQPLIAPLFGGLTELEVLGAFAGMEAPIAHKITRETYKQLTGENDWKERWKFYLHSGFEKNTTAAPEAGSEVDVLAAKTGVANPSRSDDLEVVFVRDYSVDDGRFSNNGWCQELPDPITKITWDNAVLVSRATAAERKWKNGLQVKITVGDKTLTAPVWIQPGQADNTLGLALGYGRTVGRIANFDGKPVGFNAYGLRNLDGLHFTDVTAEASRGLHEFACTQDHWSMEGRAIIREANLEGEHGYEKHPDFARHVGLDAPDHAKHTINPKTGEPYQIYKHPYKAKPELKNADVQWGMSIDLNSCVGCNACVIACQSENNIPIVGKDQVERGREMHWLRIDRYYTGAKHSPLADDTAGDDVQHNEAWIDDPQVAMQPMLCQHCESAPCETVCPVNATVHDDEGLNLMVYNRCIGTRYCSNNCAWKVRRFNFFDYNKRPLTKLYNTPLTSPSLALDWVSDREKSNKPAMEWDLLKLAKNPDVTVRMRGVMEKCTYCVQRIEKAKINRKVDASREFKDALAKGNKDAAVNSVVPDGTIKTACQQACPAEAIVFGNQADSESSVAKMKAQERDYSVLGFLDTRPHTTYLARVRNPNADMPDYTEHPYSALEYDKAAHGDHHDDHEEGGADHGEDHK